MSSDTRRSRRDTILRRGAVAVLLVASAGCAGSAAPGERAPRATANAVELATQSRPDVSGPSGAVVAGHPLAAAAGYRVLREGGNATDAVVTMAAVLAVVRPHMNGVGGDAFGLFYDGGSRTVTALNGSGRAGELASPEFFAERGLETIPGSGPMAVTVPGAVSAWAAALERYGTISLARALEPAIGYARDGWVVTATLRRDVAESSARLNDAGRAIFRPGGELPQAGGVLRNPALARTLQAIADGGADAFYRGAPGEAIAQFVEREGGYLRAGDFRAHSAEWTQPISIDHRGLRVHAFPPNSQGMAQLQMLGMAESAPIARMEHNSAEYLHTLIEIKKLAFADRDRWVADPRFAEAPLDRLLDPAYLTRRAGTVGGEAREEATPGIGDGGGDDPAAGDGDTVYTMAVDDQGNAVSWIQSLFSSWGSRLVEPETGVVLQNRGAGFTLEPGHPNRIEPGKRPFHTLSPTLITDLSGALRMTLGTPGGHGQPQFLTQVLHNIVVFGMSPQEAVEAPRFRSNDGVEVLLEDRVPPPVAGRLRAMGHDVRVTGGWSATYGGVQVIYVDPESGVLRTGADPRREAYGIAY